MTPDHRAPSIDPAPVPPPAALETRIRHAYRRRRKRLRGAGAACVLVLGVLVLAPWPGLDDTPATGTAVIPTAPASSVPDPTLQALDRALQAAYARGASDAELAPLWAARRQALATRRSRS